jgi:16S rRNA (cytosine967-C5)-methyltransferase
VLRLGVYQLLFLDKIPAYSIINEAVNLVQRAKKTSAKGLANAVLRKVANQTPELSFRDEIERISIETSHPIWLVQKWVSEFGIDETLKLCEVNNQPPNLDFRWTAKTSKQIRDRKDQLTRPEIFELAERGEIYFQDQGSQMVAEAVELKAGDRFLDVCCAPGSKLSLIVGHGEPSGLSVGGDFYHKRLLISRESCHKQGVKKVAFVQYDAADALPFADETFEVILVDAPCSGTGTIRHNPEIRYFLQESDFSELALKQLSILQQASKVLKKDGRLIYSTCSLEVEENERVMERFLTANDNFQKVPPNLSGKYLTRDKFVRTFPERDQMDGFFIAELKKR